MAPHNAHNSYRSRVWLENIIDFRSLFYFFPTLEHILNKRAPNFKGIIALFSCFSLATFVYTYNQISHHESEGKKNPLFRSKPLFARFFHAVSSS